MHVSNLTLKFFNLQSSAYVPEVSIARSSRLRVFSIRRFSFPVSTTPPTTDVLTGTRIFTNVRVSMTYFAAFSLFFSRVVALHEDKFSHIRRITLGNRARNDLKDIEILSLHLRDTYKVHFDSIVLNEM